MTTFTIQVVYETHTDVYSFVRENSSFILELAELTFPDASTIAVEKSTSHHLFHFHAKTHTKD